MGGKSAGRRLTRSAVTALPEVAVFVAVCVRRGHRAPEILRLLNARLATAEAPRLRLADITPLVTAATAIIAAVPVPLPAPSDGTPALALPPALSDRPLTPRRSCPGRRRLARACRGVS